jgi:hypothetical protein
MTLGSAKVDPPLFAIYCGFGTREKRDGVAVGVLGRGVGCFAGKRGIRRGKTQPE